MNAWLLEISRFPGDYENDSWSACRLPTLKLSYLISVVKLTPFFFWNALAILKFLLFGTLRTLPIFHSDDICAGLDAKWSLRIGLR